MTGADRAAADRGDGTADRGDGTADRTTGDPERGGRPRIGVSSCLLGSEVRFDGGHKRDLFLTGVLAAYVEWVSVCPEVEIGLGTPRPPIRLERRRGGATRLVVPSTGEDLTRRMREWAERRAEGLAALDLCGYVLKKDSPSCGMERVRVYGAGGAPSRDGRGVFAEALLRRLPTLPVEEEGRLGDPRLRENFVTRVFALHRWRLAARDGVTRAALRDFHRRHELHLVARSRAGADRLGRLLAEAPRRSDPERLAARYLEEFSRLMARPPRPAGHARALRHIAGFVSDRLDAGDRGELVAAIDACRLGLAPLIVPLTLLRHHVRRFDIADLAGQAYLEPHPAERMLLNHA